MYRASIFSSAKVSSLHRNLREPSSACPEPSPISSAIRLKQRFFGGQEPPLRLWAGDSS